MAPRDRKPTGDTTNNTEPSALRQQARAQSRPHPKTAGKEPHTNRQVVAPVISHEYAVGNHSTYNIRQPAVAEAAFGSAAHTVLHMGTKPPGTLPETVLGMTMTAEVLNLGVAGMTTHTTSMQLSTVGDKTSAPDVAPFRGKHIDFSALVTPPRETPDLPPKVKVDNFTPPLQDADPDGWQGFLKSPLKPRPESPALIDQDRWKRSLHSSVRCRTPANPLHNHLTDVFELAETIDLLKSWHAHLANRHEAATQQKAQSDLSQHIHLSKTLGDRMLHLRRMMQVIESRESYFRSLVGSGFLVPDWVLDKGTRDGAEAKWKSFVQRCVFVDDSDKKSKGVRGEPCGICGSRKWSGPDT